MTDATGIQKLVNQRNELDQQIQKNMSILNQMGVGMDKRLVDNEGFPLPGIDLYTVKELRGSTRRIRIPFPLKYFRNDE